MALPFSFRRLFASKSPAPLRRLGRRRLALEALEDRLALTTYTVTTLADGVKPSWKRPQLNRLLVQDFVIYAHSDLGLVKKLLDKEPALLNAAMDWGAGDWETGLGGASHMGRRDIAEFLLEHGARIDLFCAAMMGQLDAVRAFLTLQPALIDAKGPHGFSLHFHAQVGGKEAEKVLDYLQSVKKVELKPVPFLNKQPEPPAKK